MLFLMFKDSEAIQKLLEAILDSPGGRRSVSRLARTCKALSGVALDILWRELDSFIPMIGLFPAYLLKKSRKPGLGLVKAPLEEDWKKVLAYGERVRCITYDERINNISPSIFPMFEEYRPRNYILPHLSHLTWRAETPQGLDRAAMFLTPKLQALSLEIGLKFPQLNPFLIDVANRTRLSSFSLVSSTALPDAFTEWFRSQNQLQKIALVAPGALSPAVGKWIASLRNLRTLQLDLSGRSVIAVEGFFDDISYPSGFSTPTSVGSTDSGIFSSEEIDFTEIRKSSLRLTGDLRSKGAFPELRHVHLTGEVSNIAVFLKHLTGELTQLDLVIDDPPDKADWQDLSALISDRFKASLKFLRISATSSSRFVDLVRSTARAEPPTSHLSLKNFTSLPRLVRLDIDLPESVVFHSSDITHAATAFPNLEVLRLCPLARFPVDSGPPKIILTDLAPLLEKCTRLHTLAVVVNAHGGSEELLSSPQCSSRSLMRLHVGHSWAGDPLQVAILLSHFAPFLETLKWFHDRGRVGVIEANVQSWQKISEFLPHLQKIRIIERRVFPQPLPTRPSTSERSVVAVKIATRNVAVQALPSFVHRLVDARPQLRSVSIDATPSVAHIGIHALKLMVDQEVDVRPSTASVGTNVDAPDSKSVVNAPSLGDEMSTHDAYIHFARYIMLPTVLGLLSMARHYFISYPLSIPMRISSTFVTSFYSRKGEVQALLPEKLALHDTDPSFVISETKTDIAPDNDHEFESIIAHEEDEFELEQHKMTDDVHWLKSGTGESARNPNPIHPATRQSSLSSPASAGSFTSEFIMPEQRKQEKDFTSEVDAALPIATSLAQSGELQKAVDQLFALEKQTRNASDLSSTTRLAKTITELSYGAQDYDILNLSILTLSKKHGQLKGVVQALVEQAMGWLEETKASKGIQTWLQLVETLRSVTEGKIFLETPRARVTLLLSKYHESLAHLSLSPTSAKDSTQLACDLLTELQVETYSSMDRREKTEIIMEQMRLLIAVARQKDAALGKDAKDSIGGGEAEWVKVRVAGRKINEDFLKEKDNEQLKRKFYGLMIEHALNQSAYLDVAKYHHKVWETPSIKEDIDGEGKATLENIVYYVVLAPHNNEQSDMLNRLYTDPALEILEFQYNLVKSFVTPELMRWPSIEAVYGPFLRKTDVFSADKRWEDLHTRVIEHNIRVVANYYTRITISRLTSLLDLTAQQTEETLARLVVSGTVWARIDRPAGIINFRSRRTAEDVMNDWSSDMQKLLGLIEKAWMGVNAAQAAQSRVKA